MTATGRALGSGSLALLRRLVGFAVLGLAVGYLSTVIEGRALSDAGRALLSNPWGLAAALLCYAAAFWLRCQAWRRVLPGLTTGQSWAALHVSLLGNHVLPFRLGEALRVTSVLRRTSLPLPAVVSSAVAMRLADLAAVAVLALLMAPALLAALIVTNALADGDRIALGADTAGVAAGALVVWRWGSIVGCVVVAAVVTAALRAAGV